MKCLFRIYSVDQGEVVPDGQKVQLSDSRHTLDYSISMIHQDLLPIPYHSTLVNLWLGRYLMMGFAPFKFVNHRRLGLVLTLTHQATGMPAAFPWLGNAR